MKSCKQCEKLFDEELSKRNLSELREINYDFKILSDAKDLEYCSKFCEKKSDNTPIKVGIFRYGQTLRSRKGAADVLAATAGTGNEGDIARDKVAMAHITGGNASDKGLTRMVTEMQTEKKNNKRQAERATQKEKIDGMKERYRAKYGRDAVGA